jgi:DHA1 family multidrug resistance protein-like MFS transporter
MDNSGPPTPREGGTCAGGAADVPATDETAPVPASLDPHALEAEAELAAAGAHLPSDAPLVRRAIIGASLLLATGWSSTLVYMAVIPQLQDARHIETSQLGWIGTAGFVATFIGQVLVAPAADRRSQRQVVGLASALLVVGLSIFALPAGYEWLLVGRAVSGLGLGVLIPVVTASVMRLVDEPGRAAGRMQAAASAGIALGPLAGALLAGRISVSFILLGAAAIALAAVPAIWLLPAGRAEVTHVRGGAGELLRSRRFVGATLIGAAFMAAVGAYDTLWARYLTDLGGSATLVGLSFVLFAIPYALWAGTAGRATDRYGANLVAGTAALAMGLAIATYALSGSAILSTVVALVESSGQAFVAVAATVAVTAAAPAARQATAHGLASGLGTLVAAATSAVAAPIYAASGATVLFGITLVLYVLLMGSGLRLNRGRATAPEPGVVPAAI